MATAYAERRGATIGRPLGEGGSAAVFELGPARSAVKVYDPAFFLEGNGPAELRRAELQRGLMNHACPELIGILDVETSDGTCFVEMEFVDWPTLAEALLGVPAERVADLMRQLVSAVRFLASRGIVHRDIKPENILVSPGYDALKLIDLGVAREMQGEEDAIDATDRSGRRPFIATAQYSSPEYLFRLEAPSEALWRALTIYQLGGVLHDLVLRRPLFHAAKATGNRYNLAAAVLREVPAFDGVSAGLLPMAALAMHCLVKSPELRLRLVSLESFESTAANASEGLRKRMERAALVQRAESDLAQLGKRQDAERAGAMEAASRSVKMRLMELLGNRFPLKTVCLEPSEFKLTVKLDDRNTLDCRAHVRWDEPGNPLVGEVSLRACLNAWPEGHEPHALPVGEIDAAAAGLTALCESLTETICEAVMAAQDRIDVSPGKPAAYFDAIESARRVEPPAAPAAKGGGQ